MAEELPAREEEVVFVEGVHERNGFNGDSKSGSGMGILPMRPTGRATNKGNRFLANSTGRAFGALPRRMGWKPMPHPR